MNKQDMVKIQPCVLRVNIHCDGCAHKVQKKLQKIEGVYKVSIDVDQGKVTVTGNVDPATLIKKLEKSGKHAEMWGGQKGGSIPMMNNNQFKNFQMEKSHGGKGNNKGQHQQQHQQHKGGKGQQKGGFQPPKGGFQLPNDMQLKNDVKFSGKDKKSVKFSLPEDEEDDEDEDYFDEFEDDEGSEDDFGEGFGGHQPQGKVVQFPGHGGKGGKGVSDGHQKGKNGGKGEKGGGGKAEKSEKGGRFDMFLKSMLGKGGDKGDDGGKHFKKGDKKQEGGKNGKKKGGGGGGFAMDEGKNGGKNGKGGNHGNGGGGKMKENWNKKSGENFDGFPRLENKHPPQGFNNMNMSMNPGMMGQMPNFHPGQGLGRGGGMNAAHFPGGGGGQYANNHQQQYMDQMKMMMMMNQQQQQQQHYGNGHGGYNHGPVHHPLGYNYMAMPPAGMSYGPPPPPGSDQYTHMFSDENTGSCSIM